MKNHLHSMQRENILMGKHSLCFVVVFHRKSVKNLPLSITQLDCLPNIH